LDELPTTDYPSPEGPKAYQDPDNEAIGPLTAIDDNEPEHDVCSDSPPIETSGGRSQRSKNDRSHSPHMTAAAAAASPQQPEALVGREVSVLAGSTSVASTLDDLTRLQEMAEVDDKQEWEIDDIIDREDIDGVPHYWVEWMPTLVPKYHLKNATALVNKFEARLRAEARQCNGTWRGQRRGELPTSQAGRLVVVGACKTSETQQRKRRGRPCKQTRGIAMRQKR
jgi:hypothetical protein